MLATLSVYLCEQSWLVQQPRHDFKGLDGSVGLV